jgi:predicted nucleic acid-binding protein
MARKGVKVFLDSNVILSGLISETGAPRIILDVATLRLPFLLFSTGRYNLMEIERNLRKKMSGALPVYRRYLPRLNMEIIPLPRSGEIKRFAGRIADKDVPVILSAIRSKADFLVTGDRQHFEKLKTVDKYPLKIVTPSEFIDIFLPEILRNLDAVE